MTMKAQQISLTFMEKVSVWTLPLCSQNAYTQSSKYSSAREMIDFPLWNLILELYKHEDAKFAFFCYEISQ